MSLRPGQRETSRWRAASVLALLASFHAAASPVRDFPETSASLPPQEAPAFVFGDVERQAFYITTDGTRPLILAFDLDRIVGDPFTLTPRTLSKIFRLPPRFQLTLARFLADNAAHLALEAPPVGASDPELGAPAVLRLSEDATDGMQDRLLSALNGVFDEYDLIDFGVFILSRAPFFTLDIWERIKLTVTRHELVFAIAVALAAMAVEILTDELSAGRSGWFLRHTKTGLKLGWYVQVWDVSIREAPGGAAGLRLGWTRLETRAGMSGDLEKGNRSLSFESRIEERWLSKLIEPYGWSLTTGLGVRHKILDDDEDDAGITTINGSVSIREGTGIPRPDGRMLLFGLHGSGNTEGTKSGGISGLYGTPRRSLTGNVVVGTDADGNLVYSTLAGWNERGIGAAGRLDLGVQLAAMRMNVFLESQSAAVVLTDRGQDLSAIFKFARTVTTSMDPNVPPAEAWKAGAFVAGSIDGGIQRDDAWIRHKCEMIRGDLERIRGALERVNGLTARLLGGDGPDGDSGVSPRDERLETLWLGIYRLRLRDDYAEYRSSRLLFDARRRPSDTVSCVLDAGTVALIERETASETFGAETHPLYRDLAPGRGSRAAVAPTHSQGFEQSILRDRATGLEF